MKKKSLPKKERNVEKNNGLVLFVKGFGKRVKQIGMFIKCTQCAGMMIYTF